MGLQPTKAAALIWPLDLGGHTTAPSAQLSKSMIHFLFCACYLLVGCGRVGEKITDF